MSEVRYAHAEVPEGEESGKAGVDDRPDTELHRVQCETCGKRQQIAVPVDHLDVRLAEVATRYAASFRPDNSPRSPEEKRDYLADWAKVRWECSAVVAGVEELHVNEFTPPALAAWVKSARSIETADALTRAAQADSLRRQADALSAPSDS